MRPIGYVILPLYLLLCLIAYLVVFDGLISNLVYSPHPKIERYQFSTGNLGAVVFFTGTQSSGVAHSAQMRDTWGRFGDVVVAEYNRHRFDGPTIVRDTYNQLRRWGYSDVTIVGASLGGLLAVDLIDYDRSHGNRLRFKVIMTDPVTDGQDLFQQVAAQRISIWRPGPVGNLLLTRLFWKFGFNPPPRDQLGSGVDDELLAKHYQASKSYPLSGWTGELRYMVRHRAVELYAGIPLVVLDAENDDVVRPEAAQHALNIFGGGQIVKVPGASHIDYVEHPQAWRGGFQAAFALLPAATR